LVVRTTIGEVGGASVRFQQDVLAPDGGVAATARTVLVAWDPEERRSRPITDDERLALLRGMAPA
jgi:acyl-CoA thioesterase FadM